MKFKVGEVVELARPNRSEGLGRFGIPKECFKKRFRITGVSFSRCFIHSHEYGGFSACEDMLKSLAPVTKFDKAVAKYINKELGRGKI